jgi:hypothetical protein
MLQRPRPGEFIVDIPGLGTLLSQQAQLRAPFAGLLAEGREIVADGARCVAWSVEGMDPVGVDDPRRAIAESRLRASIAQSRHVAASIRSQLENSEAATLPPPPELVEFLGRTDASGMRLSRSDLKARSELHLRVADAVEEAIGRGSFFAGEQGVVLAEWAFLRSGVPATDAPRPVPEPRPIPAPAPTSSVADQPAHSSQSPEPTPTEPLTIPADSKNARRRGPWGWIFLAALIAAAVLALAWFLQVRFPPAPLIVRDRHALVAPRLPGEFPGGDPAETNSGRRKESGPARTNPTMRVVRPQPTDPSRPSGDPTTPPKAPPREPPGVRPPDGLPPAPQQSPPTVPPVPSERQMEVYRPGAVHGTASGSGGPR